MWGNDKHNDYLGHAVARSFGLAGSVQPRKLSHFESVAPEVADFGEPILSETWLNESAPTDGPIPSVGLPRAAAATGLADGAERKRTAQHRSLSSFIGDAGNAGVEGEVLERMDILQSPQLQPLRPTHGQPKPPDPAPEPRVWARMDFHEAQDSSERTDGQRTAWQTGQDSFLQSPIAFEIDASKSVADANREPQAIATIRAVPGVRDGRLPQTRFAQNAVNGIADLHDAQGEDSLAPFDFVQDDANGVADLRGPLKLEDFERKPERKNRTESLRAEPLSQPVPTWMARQRPGVVPRGVRRQARAAFNAANAPNFGIQADGDASLSATVAAPTIHVTIGRVEVRATPPATSSTRKPAEAKPGLSLDEYLRVRNGRNPAGGQGGA